jgi:hypothetical protein
MVTWEERIGWVVWLSVVFRFQLWWVLVHFAIFVVYAAGKNWLLRGDWHL